MVKLQKPIPKQLGNKPKLDNPIKKRKQKSNKDKTTSTDKHVKVKLLESPIAEAKTTNKRRKEEAHVKKDVKKSKVVQKEAVKGESKAVGPLIPKKLNEEPKGKKNSKKADVKGVSDKIQAQGQAVKPLVPEKVAVKGPGPIKAGESSKISVKPTHTTKSAPPSKPAPIKTVPTVKADAPVKEAAPIKATSQKKQAGPTVAKKLAPVATLPTKGPLAPPKVSKGKMKKNKKAAATVTEPTSPTEKPKVAKKVKQLQEKKKAKIAYRLAKKEQKEKKERRTDSFRYDPTPYDEEKFRAIVNVENVKKIAEALKTQVEKEVATKKSSIFEDYRYFLQVGSFKIANCPRRMVKLNLKHPLVDKDDDVLLVVPDLQRGSKVDYEPTIHHYEDMLRFHGVEGLKIMPMNQLRKEFGTYEQKRRLCATYDHFLCDGRIVSHVVGIVGKVAQKPRSTFHAVRLHEEKDIKAEIEKALRKTAYRQLAKSSLHAIPVGTHKFTAQQLAENVQLVVDQLKKVFPGGLGNIRNLYMKIDITGTSSLPLYVSMAQAPEQTPLVVGPREQRMIKLKREANEVLSKFAMTKEGKLIKLTKPEAEKKRKLQEMRAALKEDEEEAKKAKKAKKEVAADEKKKDEVKDLELPENEEDDDDDSTDDDDEEDIVNLGSSSDDDDDDEEEEEEDNDDMGEVDQEEEDNESLDAESEAEIVENGIVEGDEEETEDEDQQEADGSDSDDSEDDDDDEEGEQDDADDDDEAEESD